MSQVNVYMYMYMYMYITEQCLHVCVSMKTYKYYVRDFSGSESHPPTHIHTHKSAQPLNNAHQT